MDSLASEQTVIEKTLCECAAQYASKDARIIPLFDAAHGQYALVEEGWEGYHRLYEPLVHIERTDAALRILADYTERGIARDLIAAGIPADRIELAYKHPSVQPSRAAA